jgi:hypothetical protein
MIKIPTTRGVLTIQADIREAVFYVKEMDKAFVAGKPGDPSEATLGAADPNPCPSKKRPSSEPPTMVCEGVGPASRMGKLVGEAKLAKKEP